MTVRVARKTSRRHYTDQYIMEPTHQYDITVSRGVDVHRKNLDLFNKVSSYREHLGRAVDNMSDQTIPPADIEYLHFKCQQCNTEVIHLYFKPM